MNELHHLSSLQLGILMWFSAVVGIALFMVGVHLRSSARERRAAIARDEDGRIRKHVKMRKDAATCTPKSFGGWG